MTGFMSACQLLADFVENDVDCSEELLAAIFHLAIPLYATAYSLAYQSFGQVSHMKKSHYREAIRLSFLNDILIYPRIISSADHCSSEPWNALYACSSSSRILQAAIWQANSMIRLNTTQGDIWRMWLTLAEEDQHLYLYLTLSDPFRRMEVSFEYDKASEGFFPVTNGLHAKGRIFQLSKGVFAVNGQKYETQGNFVYNFVSRVLAISHFLFFAEAGHLIRINVDHEKQTASADFQELHATVMNIFPWGENSIGVLISLPKGGYGIRIITETLVVLAVPGLPGLEGAKLFGAGLDHALRVHLLPVDSSEVIILSPNFDTLLH